MPQNVRHILIMAAINGYEALSKETLYNIKDEKINDNFFLFKPFNISKSCLHYMKMVAHFNCYIVSY